MANAGKADKNGDGRISVKEAFDYLQGAVFDYTKKTKPQSQKPLMLCNNPNDMYFGRGR